MTGIDIFNQVIFHFSSNEEKVSNEDKTDYLEWVDKNNKKAKEMAGNYGSFN